MRKIILLGILTGIFCSGAFAEDQKSIRSPEEVTSELRTKLSPLIQAAMEKHCGEDCPSFEIQPQYKKKTQDFIEDLGFAQTGSTTPETPSLQSISVSVLVQDKVPQNSRDALKQILGHLVNNESPVPANIQIKPLAGLSPALEKQSRNVTPPPIRDDKRIKMAMRAIWPACILLVTFFAFLGLVLFLKNRRDLIRDQALASDEKRKSGSPTLPGATIKEDKAAPLYAEARAMMESRPEDLLWLIEDLTLREDLGSLRKITSLFQPQELSSKLELSSLALKTLVEVSRPKQKLSLQKVNPSEALVWLKETMNAVHWGRLAEMHFPLSKLGRLSEGQRLRVFAKLQNISEKAGFLASVPSDKWPTFLTKMTSEERIQIGAALNQYQNSSLHQRNELSAKIAGEIQTVIQENSQMNSDWMDSYSLYLNEEENQGLWEAVSKQNHSQNIEMPKAVSINNLVMDLESDAATEIFTSLEISSLGALMHQLSEEGRQKLIGSLPQGLRERVASGNTKPSDTQLMQSRASLLDAYRRFTSGNMIQ